MIRHGNKEAGDQRDPAGVLGGARVLLGHQLAGRELCSAAGRTAIVPNHAEIGVWHDAVGSCGRILRQADFTVDSSREAPLSARFSSSVNPETGVGQTASRPPGHVGDDADLQPQVQPQE